MGDVETGSLYLQCFLGLTAIVTMHQREGSSWFYYQS
jgi:hypothetical protein